MRKITTAIIVCLLICQPVFASENRGKTTEYMEQVILRLMADPIYNAITDYYGQSRQYWKDKLVDIKETPETPYFEVIVQVETFCGAHNAPYGIEIMTFHVSYGNTELMKFEHHEKSY